MLNNVHRRDFFYARLLKLIEEGKVSLLHVPPKSRSPRLAENDTSRTVNPGLDWVSWALGISSMDSAGILQECLRIFDKKHPNISDRDIRTVIEQEVLSDIVQMQLEPAIMDNYRRFVMIVETRNDQSLETSGVRVILLLAWSFTERSDRSKLSRRRSLISRTNISPLFSVAHIAKTNVYPRFYCT